MGTNIIEDLHKDIAEFSQKEKNEQTSLKLGDIAPDFTAETTFGNMKLSDYRGKWLVFFSHPGDFTPVCTTEFISFSKFYPEFKKLCCELLGLSIDSNASHLAWTYDIYKNTGIVVPFPIVADRDAKIANMYQMIAPNTSNTKTVRCVFIIDPEGKIRAILTYPLTNGRNIAEILRLLEALQLSDKEQVSTPAGWMPDQPVIVKAPNTYQELMERVKNPMDYMCLSWYLCFKNPTNYNILNNKNCDIRLSEVEEKLKK